VAFIVQAIAQQYTNASHVGIIFSLETLFAGIVAFFIAGEVLTTKSYVGAAFMITSIFIMEINLGELKSSLNKNKIRQE
jgi:drug/metabolite transporter (DMT)-like permease